MPSPISKHVVSRVASFATAQRAGTKVAAPIAQAGKHTASRSYISPAPRAPRIHPVLKGPPRYAYRKAHYNPSMASGVEW